MLRDNAPTGIWAALPTPFDEDEHLARGVISENVARLAEAGVHGVYITDADGEFYALEFEEFATVVDEFAAAAACRGIACQVGVSWSHTRGVLQRLRHCVDRGVRAAHVGHPIYMQMTRDSWLRYWDDLSAAVPENFGLIHYNTPKMPNQLKGTDYRVLAQRVPQLVGTKWVGVDVVEFGRLTRAVPELTHLVGEQAFGFLAPYGAAGIYSWFANLNPRWLLDWWHEAHTQQWSAVAARQRRILDFIDSTAILLENGNDHATIAKAMGAAFPFLVAAPTTRRPYLPVPGEQIRRWSAVVRDRFSDLLPT